MESEVQKNVAKFEAEVFVTLKPGVQDPVGRTILDSLSDLGVDGIQELSTGKYFQMVLESQSQAEAESNVDKLCDKLLANPNIETYKFTVKQKNE